MGYLTLTLLNVPEFALLSNLTHTGAEGSVDRLHKRQLN